MFLYSLLAVLLNCPDELVVLILSYDQNTFLIKDMVLSSGRSKEKIHKFSLIPGTWFLDTISRPVSLYNLNIITTLRLELIRKTFCRESFKADESSPNNEEILSIDEHAKLYTSGTHARKLKLPTDVVYDSIYVYDDQCVLLYNEDLLNPNSGKKERSSKRFKGYYRNNKFHVC
jgi:hypothetical protein